MASPFIDKQTLINKISQHSFHKVCTIRDALRIAEHAHKNQRRDDGSNCLTQHIWPITYNIVTRFYPRRDLDKLIITALLHDVLEDSHTTEEKIAQNFGPEILKNIQFLTKTKAEDDPNNLLTPKQKFQMTQRYIDRLMSAPSAAVIVKIEDRLNNLQSSYNPDKLIKYKRYARESRILYYPLINEFDLQGIYKCLYDKELERLDLLIKTKSRD